MNRIDLAPVVTLAGLREGHVTGTASLSATAKGALSTIARVAVPSSTCRTFRPTCQAFRSSW